MIFRASIVRSGLQRAAVAGVRQQSTTAKPAIPPHLLRSWYNIFGKSTGAYASWLVVGIVVAEGVTGFGGDAIWNSINRGRTYESVDWTKFKVEDDDDDDEDEEEDEEEEEEEEDEDDE